LLQRKVKVILIACNTASAVAYDALLDYLGKRANLVNVIDPVVNHIAENFSNQKVGVIGTKATINSGTYEGKIRTLNSSIEVVSLATPLLVPMIEEGFVYDDISNAIIKAYLSSDILDHIGSMILGCTHYPIVKEQIGEFFGSAVEIVDSPAIVAGYLKRILEDQALLNERKNPQHYFYISDYTEYFKNTARMFFKESINLEKLDIWKDPA
jgi:glutamate racemase